MANSTQRQWRPPVGTIQVVDPSPLDWLFITWNTMEEPIRVDQEGHIVPALATDARWLDDHTLVPMCPAGALCRQQACEFRPLPDHI